VKRQARRLALSYSGHIKDWVEFTALPAHYRPQILANAVVRFDAKLTLDLYPFAGTIDAPTLSDASTLSLFADVDPATLASQRVAEIRIAPRGDNAYTFGAEEILAPGPESSQRHERYWTNLVAARAPYDNVLAVESKSNFIRHVVMQTHGKIGKVYLDYCRSTAGDSRPEFESACATFQDEVKISVPHN
jgi:hypothetical protein